METEEGTVETKLTVAFRTLRIHLLT